MPNRQQYDLNAEWDDPYEHNQEHRAISRFLTRYKVRVAVPIENDTRKLVGVSVVRNLSLQGAYVQTKQAVETGAQVTIAFPTAICPKDMGMPRAFWGPSEVRHVTPGKHGIIYLGLRFGETLHQDMEFARFIEYLQSVSGVMTSI